jgi:O-antigen biosynthesis protein WbqV
MGGIVRLRPIRLMVWVYDMAMAVIAMYAGIILRLGNLNEIGDRHLVLGALLPFAAATGISHIVMRTYRTSWRHASIADLTNILHTVSLAVLVYLPLSFVTTRLWLIPRSSVIMAWLILFLLMTGSRLIYRLFKEGRLFLARPSMSPGQVPILIVGGGTDAEILLRAFNHYAWNGSAIPGTGCGTRGSDRRATATRS